MVTIFLLEVIESHLILDLIHGFFEIAAYFIAGLAGGIISIALIKHNLKERRVLVDSLDLILISLAMLLVAALIEVFITPILFG